MKLPEFFTQPNLFSKALSILLFVSFPFLGFYFGYSYQSANQTPERRIIEFCPEFKINPKPTQSSDIINTSTETGAASYQQIGLIKRFLDKQNSTYIDIDYVQWLSDVPGNSDPLAASRACLEAGDCKPENCDLSQGSCVTNGYYVLNQNPKIRTLELSPSVEILTLNGGTAPSPTSLSDFRAKLKSSPTAYYWIKLSSDNKVVSIRQQYQP